MAPTTPSKRPSMRSKSSSSKSGSGFMARPPSHREGAIISDSFINSKTDKRKIKHSAFLHRIEKAHIKPLKRRRPNKKLVTTLEGLADALPDVESLVAAGAGKGLGIGAGKKSLKSRPGAMKRKEKLERGERERFGRNLASIMGVPEVAATTNTAMDTSLANGTPVPAVEGAAPTPVPAASAGRFAALRTWINANMEKHPGFEKETS